MCIYIYIYIERERERERERHGCSKFDFSSVCGPARGAVETRSHNPGSDVPAAVSVTQKNTF